MGYIDVDMGQLPHGPGNRGSTHNSIGTKYEYLKHILDDEIGAYIEEVDTSEGTLLVQKSRSGKVIAVVPWDGNTIPNPTEPATDSLVKLGIGDTVYAINGMPQEPSVPGTYSLMCYTSSSMSSIDWVSTLPITDQVIDNIWENN